MASPSQFRRSRRDGSALPPVTTIATITAIVLLAGAGTVLLAPGALPLPWQRALGLAADEPALAAELPAGYVRVPLSATRIPAYAKVAREHLFDPKKVRWVETAVKRADLPSDVILERGDALGRVLRQDKPAGYVFTERDFMPEGTRPGLVGGIPAGKRGYRVEVEKIPGLYGLNAGDRFDLLATLAVDDGALDDLERVGGAYGGALALDARVSGSLQRASVRVVAQNAVIVEPVAIREVNFTSSSLTQGTKHRTRPVAEVILAIDPGEVARLEEALAIGARINCVPRSGAPEDPHDSVTPDLAPESPFSGMRPGVANAAGMRVVETIQGGKRELVPVPAAEARDG